MIHVVNSEIVLVHASIKVLNFMHKYANKIFV